jgi:tetratricopeptide (TPR) repeat protein
MRLVHVVTLTLALTPLAAAQKQNPQQLMQEARAAQASGDLPTAIRDYRFVLDMRPTLVEARVSLGSALAQQGQYDAAIEQFRTVLPHTSHKQQPAIMYAIGLAEFKKGDLAAAKAQLADTLAVEPKSTQAATLLGECDLRENNPAVALSVFGPRAGLAYDDPEFAYFYSIALMRTGAVAHGAQLLQKVADAGSTPDILQLAGIAWLVAGENEQSRRDLELAAKLNPATRDIQLQLGIVRDGVGDTFAAETAFRAALKLKPEDPSLSLYLGSILLHLKNYVEAQPLLEHALKLSPSPDLQAAIADLHKAATTDPNGASPHPQLIATFDQLRADAEAKQSLEILQALTAQPRFQ